MSGAKYEFRFPRRGSDKQDAVIELSVWCEPTESMSELLRVMASAVQAAGGTAVRVRESRSEEPL